MVRFVFLFLCTNTKNGLLAGKTQIKLLRDDSFLFLAKIENKENESLDWER